METFMNRRAIAALASIITLGFAGSAFAQSTSTAKPKGDRAKWEKNFKAADKDGDGALSKEEVNARKGFPGIKKNFDAMDANHDGKVTVAEHDAWQDSQRAARRDARKAAKASSTTK
jgi:hypothetical protein